MARKKKILGPTYKELIEPLFLVIKELGNSANNDEMRDKIIDKLNLTDKIVDEPHKGSNSRSELEYQLAWARTCLKNYGAITNTARGIWVITPKFKEIESVDCKNVIKDINENNVLKNNKAINVTDDDPSNDGIEPPEELEPWRVKLADILHNMDPFAFERLSQLLLRECGFSQVEVTQKTHDGGIDGTGKLKINGIVSFNVAFQCKRYKGSVLADDIKAFRGSLTTDIEKGVFITTGTFTKAARAEAIQTGKQQIDLIDGEELINKLIEYKIGVSEKTIFEINDDFFKNI